MNEYSNDQASIRESAVTAYPEGGQLIQPKPYEIIIQPLDYGYMVRVGCKSFAFESRTHLLEKLSRYLEDPEGLQKKFLSNELFITQKSNGHLQTENTVNG